MFVLYININNEHFEHESWTINQYAQSINLQQMPHSICDAPDSICVAIYF